MDEWNEPEDQIHDENKPETPLPIRTMVILCLTILSEPISFTILFPFVYFMVKDFNIAKEEDIGYYVGFIASSFSFAQLLTSMFWGYMSDKFGRRPILLIGLIGNSVSMILFGLSKSLPWAIASRSLCGLLNGNIGVAKSVLGEITDSTNRARAFSLIALNFGIGSIIGPALGGLLAKPTETYPDIFGGIEFLKTFPYFLPCLCSATITLFGFTFGYFCLPETNPKQYIKVANEDSQESLTFEPDTVEAPAFDDPEIAREITEASLTDSSNTLVQNEGIGLPAIASALAYALLAFSDILFVETFPLWAVSKPSIGLGFDGTRIGIMFSICGIFILTNQVVIYPAIAKRMSSIRLFQISSLIILLFPYMFPMISYFLASNPNLEFLVWPALLTTMATRTIINGFLFTTVFVVVTISAKPGQLGLVNGLAQGAASFTRTIGPALGGSMWAWSLQNGLPTPFNHVFIFTFILFMSAVLALQAHFML
ncbi:hypothetical protein HDV04_002230 [Boothiomyces sp. JEL0838]|nr:hypothetical protein HDV04_002230 [Boothiomyces sp. JEL0838]